MSCSSIAFRRHAHAWRSFLHTAIGLIAVFLAIDSTQAAVAAVGVVRGQVSNQATGAFLEGARVEVKGSAHVTTTDREGRFELELPPGATVLRVTYTGLDPQEIAVDVVAGQAISRNVELTAGIYKMEAFTVATQREGTAAAIMRQQQAANVKNVVSSDSFGNVADGNIGDFLQQMPGVTAVYVGADVRSVQIRGIGSDLNSVTMDGDRIASAPSNQSSRTFEFEQASLGLIETIEVIKAPTPDMDADSIGGAVNLISKSSFDRAQKRFFSYSFGGVWRPKYQTNSKEFLREPITDIGPSVNLTYADRFGERQNLGVVLTATYHSQPGGDTAALLNYGSTLGETWISSVNAPRPAGAPRTRLALGAKFDYKWSDRTIVSLNTFCNLFHENNHTSQFIQSVTGTPTAANFAPGFSTFYTEVLASAATQSQLQVINDDKYGRTYAFQPSVRHRFPGLEIDYGASYSNSLTAWEEGGPFGRHYPTSRAKGRVTMTMRNVGFIVDRRANPQWPTVTQTAGPDIYNLANYTGQGSAVAGLNILQNDRSSRDEILSARFNLRKRIELPVETFVKLGASVREQTRSQFFPVRSFDYVGPDRILNSGDENPAQWLDRSGQWSDANNGLRMPPWPSAYAIAKDLQLHPEHWRENYTTFYTNLYANTREATETVSSAYAMGTVKLGNLFILAGLRVEDTRTDGEGSFSRVTPEEAARRAAYTGDLANDPVEQRRRVEAQYATRARSSGQYRNVFPGVHFKYTTPSGWVGRLSYSSSIGRPLFSDIMPATTVDDVNRIVSVANTSLRPQYSDNFDAGVEYYFEPAGVVSVNAFLKEVADFQFTSNAGVIATGADNGFDGQFAGYTLSTKLNGGSARYRGIELSYRQQFTFLPGHWRGLGAGVNYTYLETFGDYGGLSATTQVANFVPKTGNVHVSYILGRWDVRVNAVWRAETLTLVNANPALLRYQFPKTQVNVKLKYKLSPRFGLFCDIENINESPITETYQGAKDRNFETRIVAPKIVAGVQGYF